jgi:hypothetical protein
MWYQVVPDSESRVRHWQEVCGFTNLMFSGHECVTTKPIDPFVGTAIKALPHLAELLDTSPEGFHSEKEAIEWQ